MLDHLYYKNVAGIDRDSPLAVISWQLIDAQSSGGIFQEEELIIPIKINALATAPSARSRAWSTMLGTKYFLRTMKI